MPYINVDIDDTVQVNLDINDFLDNCDDEDIKNIIEYLREDGHLIYKDLTENITEIDKFLFKIADAQIQLTTEEEIIIKNIATRLV
jgi:hypothetical protein